MKLGLLTGVFLAGVLSSLQQDDVFGNDYLVDELPGQREKSGFRPRSAKEAMRQASRLAQKIRSEESHQSYALLQGPAIGGAKGLRVKVYDAVEETTLKFNYRRSQHSRKRGYSNEIPVVRRRSNDPLPPLPAKIRFNERYDSQRAARRPRPMERDRHGHVKKPKRPREKRAVDDRTRDTGFNLPPMSNEWKIQKKKKKKKKKTVTDAPTTPKKMQKKSKKFRIYMESDELTLKKGKASPPKIVANLADELDRLLKNVDDMEEYTSSPLAMPTKAKFVQIPKNWQSPPSWKPPTRGPGKGGFRGRLRPYSEEIVTIGPQVISEESTEAGEKRKMAGGDEYSTLYNWKQFDHPHNPTVGPDDERLIFKPAPEDWPEPTHPADGIYDWHKSQFKRVPQSMRPRFITHSSHVTNEKQISEETAMFRRNNMWQTMPYVRRKMPPPRHTTWHWAKAADEESALFHRNDMWQTRPYVRPTLPSLAPERSDVDINKLYYSQTLKGKWQPEVELLKEKGELHLTSKKQGQSVENIHLTTGPPLAVDWESVHPEEREVSGKEDDAAPDSIKHQETYQHNYHYSPQHMAWQSHSQGVQRGKESQTHYQGYQSYYANYTNYYNQHYQNYYSQLANKSAAYHYEQAHHSQDKHSASGHYQSQYLYQGQAQRQSGLRPPAYFHNPLEETSSTVEETTVCSLNQRSQTLEVPYRFPNEYAGNDRDLRGHVYKGGYDSSPGYAVYSRARGATRYRRPAPLRRGYQSRQRRPWGFRPTGYRSIFTAPLQKGHWTTIMSR